MNGESSQPECSWTVDTLAVHLTRLLTEMDSRYEQRFRAQEIAIEKAEQNAERWRQNANEWRGAMNDRERLLMSRGEAENSLQSNSEKIGAIAARLDRNEGRMSGLLMIFVIIATLGALVGIFAAIKN